MRDLYNAKLARLSDEIMEMGNLCGQAIMKTCQLLASVEIRETASKEIGKIEKEIDDKEHNIEALCMAAAFETAAGRNGSEKDFSSP